jgi:hypothetical protein
LSRWAEINPDEGRESEFSIQELRKDLNLLFGVDFGYFRLTLEFFKLSC